MRRMKSSSRSATLARCLAAIALAACGVNAMGQDGTPPATQVLKDGEVTQENLLRALTPPEPDVTLRSIRARPTPPRKASASLLITFETNSSIITGHAREQLDVVASALSNERLAEYSFNVEGHADPRGNPDSNFSLSQLRAESVRNYLVSAHGIDPARLKALGKGDRELLNTQVPAAPENRRVTIVTNVPDATP